MRRAWGPQRDRSSTGAGQDLVSRKLEVGRRPREHSPPASRPRAPARARTRGRSGNGAAGPRVRAASGSGCESGSGRLEPGAGRGPVLWVRRQQQRRRRLGRRVQASGARSVRWVGGCLHSQCVHLPLPLPRSLSPSSLASYPTQTPPQGAAGPLPLSFLPLPILTRPCFSFPCPGQPPP